MGNIENVTKETRDSGNKSLAVISGIAVVLFLLAVLLMTNRKEDPFDYAVVGFEGFNGYGKVVVQLDESTMADKIYGSSDGYENPENLEEIQILFEIMLPQSHWL